MAEWHQESTLSDTPEPPTEVIEELDHLRRQVAGLSKTLAAIVKDEFSKRGFPVGIITCEKCPLNGTCEYAWDLYNTDGDYLAEK